MRRLVSEKKIGLAILACALGIILVSQASLFSHPVLVSEKGLLLLISGVVLLLSSVVLAVYFVRIV